MAGLKPKYQEIILANTLYETNISVQSGLGDSLKPMAGFIGAAPLITVYGAYEEPSTVTLANIATKMFVIKDDFSNGAFDAIPNYLAFILKSGTVTSAVISSIKVTNPVAIA